MMTNDLTGHLPCFKGVGLMTVIVCLSGMAEPSYADPIRHCSAAYTVQFKTAVMGTVVGTARMGRFKTTSRCSLKSAAIQCRKMARGRAHACMSAHWKIREKEPPAACSGRLKDYPSGPLSKRLKSFVCEYARAHGHTALVVDVMASTFGSEQCMGEAHLSTGLRVDCT